MSVAGRAGWQSLRAVGDWLTARDRDPELRDELIATLIQRRPAVFVSAAGILLMSATAAWIVAAPWTFAWLATDLVLLACRIRLSFRHDRGGDGPAEGRGIVVALMLLLFIVFGAGCAALIATGPIVLMMMALISMMGVFSGLVTRWAAFPRLALIPIGLLSASLGTALGLRTGAGLPFAAFQFLLILGTTAAQILQNHRILLRMLRAERRNWLMARRDSLTGLGNRILLAEALDSACSALAADPFERSRHFALLYLDLDGFKSINDTLGHEGGDRLLEAIGGTLAAAVRPGDRAFRVGGDEFIILALGAGEGDAASLARRIIAAIPAALPVRLPERGVTASIGITLACTDGADHQILLAEADAALYFAKRQGKACFHLYGSEEAPLLRAS